VAARAPIVAVLAVALTVAVALAVAGCGSRAPHASGARTGSAPAGTPLPTPPIPGLSWTTAASVERPAAAFANSSAEATTPAGPGTAGHPGHFYGQAIVSDVVDTGSILVAVGYVGLEATWTALAWTSIDGRTWTLHQVDTTAGSFAVSVTVAGAWEHGGTRAGTGPIVAVGRSADRAVAWTSTDGASWDRHVLPAVGADWERAVTILGTADGFVAGGSAGPELGQRHARIWRSADGVAWVADPDSAAFDGGEVVALADLDGDEIALGRLGTGQRSTSSVAWARGRDGAWARSSDPGLDSGLVNAVAPGIGGGLLAVGSDGDERAAIAWHSLDGRAWPMLPTSDALTYYGGKARMLDVVVDGPVYVAVGDVNPMQYGTATSWRSADGRSWERSGLQPVLNQGEMLALARTRLGLTAVGSFGAPDNYIPTIWLGPTEPRRAM
jgi:hypothetical protein